MADACAPVPSGPGFLAAALNFIDCQAEGVGQGGYQALTMPGSIGATMTGAALTLFVALVGYRLLLGERLAIRDGVVAAAKIGVVLMLAASWPAFRILVYDITMHGPAELAATIATPAALPGAGGGLVAQLQLVDDGLAEFAQLGAGRPPQAELEAGPTVPLNAQQQQQEQQRLQQIAQRPRWDPQRDAAQIGSARTVYLAATIGAFAALRLLAGLLIALGPVFLLFLLFDTTRGVFEAWVRGLGGVTVAAAAASIVLGVELALVGPWLAGVLEQRRAGEVTVGAPTELIAVTIVFAVALVAVLIGSAKVAHGFRLPAAVRRVAGAVASTTLLRDGEREAARTEVAAAVRIERSRATEVAQAVTAAQRRETVAALPPATRLAQAVAARGGAAADAPARDPDGAIGARDGGASRRRVRGRLSAGGARRDRLA